VDVAAFQLAVGLGGLLHGHGFVRAQAEPARGQIAGGMFLSRRTVHTYISRILAKLGAKGRVDIVRAALQQGISP
jgi:Bacterial regulatory proteins, luxR family